MHGIPALVDLELFALIFVRLTALLILFPIFGFSVLPVHYRVALSFYLALLLFPLLRPEFTALAVDTIWQFLWIICQEVAIGITIGFFTRFLFAAISAAGDFIDLQLGFSMVQLPNPLVEGEMVTASGYFYLLIFGIIFLLMNGHYFLLMTIYKSFQYMPPGNVIISTEPILTLVLTMLLRLYEVAIRLSAPIIIVLMVTTVALGIITKTMPEMNVFVVGMPLKIGVGFVAMIIAFPAMVRLFEGVVHQLYRDVWTLLIRLAGT